MSWKKIEPSQSATWEPEQEPTLEGQYKGLKTKVGPNESNLYLFKKDNEEEVAVWGSAVIDSRMAEVPVGARVKIEFLGEEKSENTGRTYKNYAVYVDAQDN